MKVPKRVQILKDLRKRPKSGATVWELNQRHYTNDARKRVSELINDDGIRINKGIRKRPDGKISETYILADPNQPEVLKLIARYGA